MHQPVKKNYSRCSLFLFIRRIHGIPTDHIPHLRVFYIYSKYVLSTFSGCTTVRYTPYLHHLHLLQICVFNVLVGYRWMVYFTIALFPYAPMIYPTFAYFIYAANMSYLRFLGLPPYDLLHICIIWIYFESAFSTFLWDTVSL